MIHEEKKDHTEDETCRDELKVALASVGFSLFFSLLFFLSFSIASEEILVRVSPVGCRWRASF